MSPAETELGPATRAATDKSGLDKVVASGKRLTSDEAALGDHAIVAGPVRIIEEMTH